MDPPDPQQLDDLNRRLARKTQEVRIIQEVASEMNATLDLDAILQIILGSMDKVFGYRHAMMLLVDPQQTFLRVVASHGYPESGVGAIVPIGQGIIGTVAKRKKMMRIGNVGSQLHYFAAVRGRMVDAGMTENLTVASRLPGLENVQSQVAIPLVVKERLVGVFAVESPTPNVFDERDEALIGILASQAASAIHNAQLYRAVDEAKANLEEKVAARTIELEKANARVIQSEKIASLGRLVAGIAHQMNTPLGSTASAHDTLTRALGKLDEEIEAELPREGAARKRIARIVGVIGDASRVMQQGNERISSIVRRLRSFARLDEAVIKVADIQEGLEDTLSLLAHELEGVELVREYGTLPAIACRPAQLNQVFLSILRNARQALREKGRIVVRTSRSEGHIIVQIEDNGCGIEPEDLRRVFDPGFTLWGLGVGTGLGLTIALQIMVDHQGELRVASQPGAGTTVTLVLPERSPDLLT